MTVRLISTFFITITFPFILSAQDKQQTQALNEFLEKEYPENDPGAVVLIAKNNQIVFKNAFGLSDVKKKNPIKTENIFQIGSMSKQLTKLTITDTDKMESKTVKVEIQFTRNNQGEINGFIADQNGKTEWRKIK